VSRLAWSHVTSRRQASCRTDAAPRTDITAHDSRRGATRFDTRGTRSDNRARGDALY
jgi:hypothetical protein